MRAVLELLGLALDAVGLPLRGELARGPTRNRMRPVTRCSARKRRARSARVARRVDGEGEHRHVVAEVVQRAADLLGGQRARVLARRVEERDHDGLAAVLAERRDLAVLVAQPEVGRRDARRADARPAKRVLRAGRSSPLPSVSKNAAATANEAARRTARRARSGTSDEGSGARREPPILRKALKSTAIQEFSS